MNVFELAQQKGLQPRWVASTHGGEYCSPCPGCGGDDRFRIWPKQNQGEGSYWCRKCEKKGDGIQFLRDFEQLSFGEARRRLGKAPRGFDAGRLTRPSVRLAAAAWRPKQEEDGAVSARWQDEAEKLVVRGRGRLRGQRGILDWLEQRGLRPETVERARLGWNESGRGGDVFESRADFGLPIEHRADGRPKLLWIPKGLLIPLLDETGEVLRIRIRRWERDEGPSYYILPGSSSRPMWLGSRKSAVVVVESELDALLVHQEAGSLVSVLGMGSAAVKPDLATHQRLSRASLVLVALDFDTAGMKSFSFWRSTYPQAKCWPVPKGKDPGEAFQLGIDIRRWVELGLPVKWKLEAMER